MTLIDQLYALEIKVYALLDMEEEEVDSFHFKRKDDYIHKKGDNYGDY